MIKAKAFAILKRFLISISLILLILIPIYFVWYPWSLGKALELHKIIILILMINLIISIMGGVFFNPRRKDNKNNMLFISVIQCIAFLLAFFFVVQGRPVWLVQHQDRIYVIQSASVNTYEQNSYLDFFSQPWLGPELKTVRFSDSAMIRERQLFDSVSGSGIEFQPKKYFAYDPQFANLFTKEIVELELFNNKERIRYALKNQDIASIKWLPVKTTNDGIDMVAILDKDGQFIKIVDLRPWK